MNLGVKDCGGEEAGRFPVSATPAHEYLGFVRRADDCSDDLGIGGSQDDAEGFTRHSHFLVLKDALLIQIHPSLQHKSTGGTQEVLSEVWHSTVYLLSSRNPQFRRHGIRDMHSMGTVVCFIQE